MCITVVILLFRDGENKLIFSIVSTCFPWLSQKYPNKSLIYVYYIQQHHNFSYSSVHNEPIIMYRLVCTSICTLFNSHNSLIWRKASTYVYLHRLLYCNLIKYWPFSGTIKLLIESQLFMSLLSLTSIMLWVEGDLVSKSLLWSGQVIY